MVHGMKQAIADPPVLVFARNLREARTYARQERLERWLYAHRPEQLRGLRAPQDVHYVDGYWEHPAWQAMSEALRVIGATG